MANLNLEWPLDRDDGREESLILETRWLDLDERGNPFIRLTRWWPEKACGIAGTFTIRAARETLELIGDAEKETFTQKTFELKVLQFFNINEVAEKRLYTVQPKGKTLKLQVWSEADLRYIKQLLTDLIASRP